MVIKLLTLSWALLGNPCQTANTVCQFESKGIAVYIVHDADMRRVIIENGFGNWADYRCLNSGNEFCGSGLKWIACGDDSCLQYQRGKTSTLLKLAGSGSGSARNVFDLTTAKSDVETLFSISKHILADKTNIKLKQCDGALQVFRVGSKLGACKGAFWFDAQNMP